MDGTGCPHRLRKRMARCAVNERPGRFNDLQHECFCAASALIFYRMNRRTTKHSRVNAASGKFVLICASSPREISKVEPFLQGINQSAGLDDGTLYRLLVACTEAVNNAILHGNHSDPEKHVRIQCVFTVTKLKVNVTDEGEGFEPENLPNPLEEKNLLRENGRGVFLIRSLMDEVKFVKRKKGMTLQMALHLKR
jgi:serine/threonine-protein kinase RsbW